MSFDSTITDALNEAAAEAGREVTLRRNRTAVPVTAIPASTTTEIEGEQGKTKQQLRDYLIQASDYDFGDGPEKPRAGDEIDDLGETFELVKRNNMPCWSWSDRGQTYYRVRTEEKS